MKSVAGVLFVAASSLACGGPAQVDPALQSRVDALVAAAARADGTRRDALAGVLDSAVTWVDARGVANGVDAVAALSSSSFSITGTLAAHHDVASVEATVDGEAAVLLLRSTGERFNAVVVMPAAPGSKDATPGEVRAYQAAWNQRRNTARLEDLQEGWDSTARYVDPQADVTGQDALNDHIAGYQRMFAPTTLVTKDYVERHGWVLFRWAIQGPGGFTVTPGFDVGHRAGDGRLDLIVGFF